MPSPFSLFAREITAPGDGVEARLLGVTRELSGPVWVQGCNSWQGTLYPRPLQGLGSPVRQACCITLPDSTALLGWSPPYQGEGWRAAARRGEGLSSG